MAPSDKMRTSNVDTNELLDLGRSVAVIKKSVDTIANEQIPSIAKDVREARDGVIRLTVTQDDIARRVTVVENEESPDHECKQEFRIEELFSKWKYMIGIIIPIAFAVIGAYVTMNRLDAVLAVRVDTNRATLIRQEKSFDDLDKTIRDNVIPTLTALKQRKTKDPMPEMNDLIYLTDREQQDLLRLLRKAKNGR